MKVTKLTWDNMNVRLNKKKEVEAISFLKVTLGQFTKVRTC